MNSGFPFQACTSIQVELTIPSSPLSHALAAQLQGYDLGLIQKTYVQEYLIS